MYFQRFYLLFYAKPFQPKVSFLFPIWLHPDCLRYKRIVDELEFPLEKNVLFDADNNIDHFDCTPHQQIPPSWWHQPFPAQVSTHPTGPIFRLLSQISHDGRFFPAHREQISFGSKQKPIKPPQKQLVAPAAKKIWHAGVPLFLFTSITAALIFT
jgi:hypothetical protein